jgi:hypothetical protein
MQVNPKGEMKGSQIAGPVAKECADLWRAFAESSSARINWGRPLYADSLPARDPRGFPPHSAYRLQRRNCCVSLSHAPATKIASSRKADSFLLLFHS